MATKFKFAENQVLKQIGIRAWDVGISDGKIQVAVDYKDVDDLHELDLFEPVTTGAKRYAKIIQIGANKVAPLYSVSDEDYKALAAFVAARPTRRAARGALLTPSVTEATERYAVSDKFTNNVTRVTYVQSEVIGTVTAQVVVGGEVHEVTGQVFQFFRDAQAHPEAGQWECVMRRKAKGVMRKFFVAQLLDNSGNVHRVGDWWLRGLAAEIRRIEEELTGEYRLLEGIPEFIRDTGKDADEDTADEDTADEDTADEDTADEEDEEDEEDEQDEEDEDEDE